MLYKKLRLRLDQIKKKIRKLVRLEKSDRINEIESGSFTHWKINLCGCLKILIVFMIGVNPMHKILKFTKIYVYNVYF